MRGDRKLTNMPQQLANFPTPEEYKEMYSKWSKQNLPNTTPNSYKTSASMPNSGTVMTIVLMTLAIIIMILFVAVYSLRQDAMNNEILNRLNTTLTNMVASSASSSSSATSSAAK